jgi:hypothetical protein
MNGMEIFILLMKGGFTYVVGTRAVDGSDVGVLVDFPSHRIPDLYSLRRLRNPDAHYRRPFHVLGTASSR